MSGAKGFFYFKEVIAPNKLLFYLILNALEQTGAQADGGGVHRGKTLADAGRYCKYSLNAGAKILKNLESKNIYTKKCSIYF